jgi:hypothetical protein
MAISFLDFIIVLLMVLLPLAAMLYVVWRIYQQIQQRLAMLENSERSLQRDLQLLCNTAARQGERVVQLEQQMQRLIEAQREFGQRQERILQGEGDGERTFDQAIKLARKGASIEELMEICGLPRGEAELVAMMHRLTPPRG